MILGGVVLVSSHSVISVIQSITEDSVSLFSSSALSGCVNSPHSLEMAALVSGITFIYFKVKGQNMVKKKKKE